MDQGGCEADNQEKVGKISSKRGKLCVSGRKETPKREIFNKNGRGGAMLRRGERICLPSSERSAGSSSGGTPIKKKGGATARSRTDEGRGCV